MKMPLRIRTAACLTALAGLAVTALAAPSTSAGAPTKSKVLQILVTNDDGVGAPGINAAVNALKALPNTKVTVVAPLTNESGTGAKTTTGTTLTVTAATTASGYPAKAVAGYPADTVIWAIDDHGISFTPSLVVSGINFGQNIGPLASLSGTVGAAETALARGIPALAVSQGIDNNLNPNFGQGSKFLVGWVQAHRKALLSGKKGLAKVLKGNLNVPTCAANTIRGPVYVPLATSLTGYSISKVNCTSKLKKPKNDVQAFLNGMAPIAPIQPTNIPASTSGAAGG